MFNLRFYSEYDSYHAAFRIIRMADAFETKRPLDAYRIADFFFVHPFELDRISMPKGISAHRALAESYQSHKPYRYSSNAEQTSLYMWPFQQVALNALAAKGVLDPTDLADGYVRVVPDKAVPLDVLVTLTTSRASDLDKSLIGFLKSIMDQFDIVGPNGLKARSKILNTSYDVRRHGVVD